MKDEALDPSLEPVWPSGKASKQKDLGSIPLRLLSVSPLKGCGLIVTLSMTINETLKWLSPLPILMQNHSGGDSVALGIASLFLHLLGSRSPPGPLRRQLDVEQV